MRNILLTFAAAVFCLLSFKTPTGITVKGTVTDEKGNALPSVSVMEKGTKRATTTDSLGHYELTVTDNKSILVFAYVGYEMKNEKVGDRTVINVKLKILIQDLEEVVTVARDHVRAPVNPPGYMQTDQPLMGMVAGVTVNAKRGHADRRVNNVVGYGAFDRKRSQPFNTEDYDAIVENRFLTAVQNPLSTFSIDVDPAAYSNVRRFLQAGELPPAGAVRIEEMVNYFHYDYPAPEGDAPFSINTEMNACPWSPQHKLVLVGLQGKKIATDKLPPTNLVFLIDVSGSMDEPNKLPLVKASMKLLVDQLRPQDRVAIVVYAGNAGEVLPSTGGAEKQTIKDAIDRLDAGGSTAGGEGIRLAYKVAKEHFIREGNNRVILCTDGDFNVGVSSEAALDALITEERESGVFLTVLGYGTGNYKDSKMEHLADKGNGNHAYIDNFMEAKKVLVSEFGGTLFTIAKDVKLQIEFNPAQVQAYRLIGYENRLLNKEDFNNDKKDAGELGSGHTVTALYEIIPAGVANNFEEKVDPLKYQPVADKPGKAVPKENVSGEMMTIKFRYKKPDGEKSQLLVRTLANKPVEGTGSLNFRFAAAVAEFGLLLRHSEFKQAASFDNTLLLAQSALGKDEEGYRAEFLRLLSSARLLAKSEQPSGEEQLSKK